MNMKDYIRERAAETETLQQLSEESALQVEEQVARADAYKNAYDAFFDGLKYVGDPNKPFTFISPMMVKPNLYYIKDGKLYVSMKNGLCTDETFYDDMVEM